MSSTSIVDDIFLCERGGSTYFNLSPMKLKRISIFIWLALVRFILFHLYYRRILNLRLSLYFIRLPYKRVKLGIVMQFKMEYHEPYGKVGYK